MRKIVTDGGTDQGLVLLVLEAAEEVRGYLKLQLHCRLLLPRPPHLRRSCHQLSWWCSTLHHSHEGR